MLSLDSSKKLFVAYLTAGLPKPQSFVELISEISRYADAIEVGLPFSDPIMDGPIIQEASSQALRQGVTVDRCFDLIKQANEYAKCPLLVMTYYNPIHRMGVSGFIAKLVVSGVAGLIVPDLPIEESAELADAATAADIALVQMVAPTTSHERAKRIVSSCHGFIYAVSRLGVTGGTDDLTEAAKQVIDRIGPNPPLPVLLGIGISNADQASEAAALADGVIVGSALMQRVLAGDIEGAVTLANQIRRRVSQNIPGQ
ncbi:MAG: tryptophan synthase subunit alpha [Actinomycetota bacterium]